MNLREQELRRRPQHLSPVVRSALDFATTHGQPGVRLAKSLGALSDRAKLPLVSLDADQLLDAAHEETGLSDWGSMDDFRPALGVLLESFEKDAHLSLFGRIGVKRELSRLLAMRLCIQDDLRRHPEILATPIRRPLFVVGLPRTGTTLLHKLLSTDPNGRAPLLWELWYPSTSPRWDLDAGDPRIAKTDLTVRLLSVAHPNFSSIHHLAPNEPDECFHLLQATFSCAMFTMLGDLKSYFAWLLEQDLRPAYRYYRRQLQRLQFGQPERHWLLKSPVHLFALDALFDAFPDACVIQTHRHPLHAAASCCSMLRATRTIHSDRVDPRALGPDWMETWGTGMDRAMTARERIDPARIVDVGYDELMTDPLRAVHRIYEYFGYEMEPAMVEAMTRWLRDNPQHKHGAHRYAPDEFGLDARAVERRFTDYCARFVRGAHD